MNKTSFLCNTNWIVDPEGNKTNIATLLGIQVFLVLITLFLNAVEFIVVWGAKECVGTKKAILLNLCISDFLHGLITQLIYTVFLAFQLNGRIICVVARACMSTCLLLTQVSSLGLLLASAERYLCIVHPFVHQRYEGSCLWVFSVAIVWTVAVIITILYYLNYKGGLILAASLVITCVSIGFMYAKIGILAIKARKEIQQQCASVGREQRKNRNSAKLIALLIVLSIICYAPFSYCILVTSVGRSNRSERVIVNWLWCLLTVSSVLNPICYCLINKTLRQKCLELFRIKHVRE